METVSRAPLISAIVHEVLEDLKAEDTISFDVAEVTSITDVIVITTATSSRHSRSIAERVRERIKKAGFQILSMEGENVGEWILIDMGDIILHVMLQEKRDYYALEKLWSHDAEPCASSSSQ